MTDFEGIDLLPEEKEQAEAAKAEIESFRERSVRERTKRKPVRELCYGQTTLLPLRP